MTALQTFILLVFAVTGLFLVVLSPGRSTRKRLAGMSREEVNAYYRLKDADGLSNGFRLFPGYALDILQTILVEPGYALWAIFVHVQPTVLAYGSLGVVLLNVFVGLLQYVLQKNNPVVYTPITWWYWVRAAVWALPTLYLWFLFAVMIGLLR